MCLFGDDVRHCVKSINGCDQPCDFGCRTAPRAGSREQRNVVSAVASFHHLSAVVIFLDEFAVTLMRIVSHLIAAFVFVVVSCDMHVKASCRMKYIFLYELFIWFA